MSNKFLSICLVAGILAFANSAYAARYTSSGSVGRFDPATINPDGHGVRIGGFTLYPSLALVGGFDDNIYAANTNTVDDKFASLRGSAVLRSNWSRHLFVLGVSGNRISYSDQENLNRTNLAVDVRTVFDLGHATELSVRARYTELQNEHGDTDLPLGAAEATHSRTLMGQVGIQHDFAAFTVSAGGTISNQDFDDVRLNNNTLQDNDIRDRQETALRARISAPISPTVSVFVGGNWNERSYDQAPLPMTLTRDSNGYRVAAGASFNFPGRLTGEVFAGYFKQDYEALTDVDGLAFGANLEWNPTTLTQIDLYAEREVQETADVGSSSYIRDAFGGQVQHELLRTLMLRGGAEFTHNDYQTSGRDEDLLATSLGVAWLASRQITVELAHNWRQRKTNVLGADFDGNRITLSVNGSF